jgi:protein-S-isoprenylcysteine O-methyltransferase Ste14
MDAVGLSKIESIKKPFLWLGAIALLIAVAFSEPSVGAGESHKTAKLIGYTLITLAMLGRVWCAIYIDGRKNDQLIQDGPYSMCRNPLYLFSFVGVVGILVGIKAFLLLLVVIPIYWLYYFYVVKSEERRLANIFGREFIDYRGKVNRFLPGLRHYWSRDTIEVNSRLIFRSIIRASFFMWSLVLIDIFEGIKLIEVNGKTIIPSLWNLPF